MQEKALQYVPIDCRMAKSPKLYHFRELIESPEPENAHIYFINLLCEVGLTFPEGTMNGITDAYLAKMGGYKGDSNAFRCALVKSGLIRVVKRGKKFIDAEICNWDEYGGQVIKSRKYHRERRKNKGLANAAQTSHKQRASFSKLNAIDNNVNVNVNNGRRKKKIEYAAGEKFKALRVYSHFRKFHPRMLKVPSDSTLAPIVAAFRSGRSVRDLNDCADGYHQDPWWSTNRPNLMRINWVFQNDENINQGITLYGQRPKAKPKSNHLVGEWYSIMTDLGVTFSRAELDEIAKANPPKKEFIVAIKSIKRSERTASAVKGVIHAGV